MVRITVSNESYAGENAKVKRCSRANQRVIQRSRSIVAFVVGALGTISRILSVSQDTLSIPDFTGSAQLAAVPRTAEDRVVFLSCR